jgi:organic hydroperoxide reductase OsmC/OhrA
MNASYSATVTWQRNGQIFIDNKYSRVHAWKFDGGLEISASSSPHVVPLPYSDESAVDPEEAFIASISSCHMLFFLSFAAQRSFLVDSYTDYAYGILSKNKSGKSYLSRVTLQPVIRFSGEHIPDQQQIETLHHLSHENCFIANSVKTDIDIITDS